MQSCWSVLYAGSHNAKSINKLERLAHFRAQELEQERFILDGEKLEHSTFLVEHDASAWEELVLEMLQVARLIFPVWKITIDNKMLSGDTSSDIDGVGYHQRIKGHRNIRREINESQQYRRMSWLNGQPHQW